MQQSEIRDRINATVDECEWIVDTRRRWLEGLEAGKYSERLLQAGVSKRELMAAYRAELETAQRVIDDLEPICRAMGWEKPGGAATPPDGGSAA
jgi:hypothetical protein